MGKTKISFRNKIIKQGNGYGVRVPMYYIRSGIIDPTKEYFITLKKVCAS